MKYAEAIHKLFDLQTRGVRLGVERTRAALHLRGSPERGISFIQVAGTNGKGSAAAVLDASLRAAGYRAGLFTSPHLHRFVERIRIAGRPLAETEAARRVEELLRAFSAAGAPELSFFEITTLLAIEAFRDHGCEMAVLEVGLGGRLDSTTAVPAILSLITRIALDHTEILGNSTSAIAREKAAILRHGIPAVIGRCDPAARRVIAARAKSVGAPCLWIDSDFRVESVGERGEFNLRVGDTLVTKIKLGLRGAHQMDNAACAAAALVRLRRLEFDIPDAAIRDGLRKVKWPGRLERIAGRPTLLLDAAHNPDGCAALAAFLADNRPPNNKLALIFGAMNDKDYPAMLNILAPLFDAVFYAQLPMPRAASCAELKRAWPGVTTRGAADALRRARRAAGPEGWVVIAGSIFLMAEARALVLGLRADPLIRM